MGFFLKFSFGVDQPLISIIGMLGQEDVIDSLIILTAKSDRGYVLTYSTAL